MEPMVTPQELADMLRVPIRTVYAWNHAGTGPPVFHIGKHARYLAADVTSWLWERSQ